MWRFPPSGSVALRNGSMLSRLAKQHISQSIASPAPSPAKPLTLSMQKRMTVDHVVEFARDAPRSRATLLRRLAIARLLTDSSNTCSTLVRVQISARWLWHDRGIPVPFELQVRASFRAQCSILAQAASGPLAMVEEKSLVCCSKLGPVKESGSQRKPACRASTVKEPSEAISFFFGSRRPWPREHSVSECAEPPPPLQRPRMSHQAKFPPQLGPPDPGQRSASQQAQERK